jgi:hypothetical protein
MPRALTAARASVAAGQVELYLAAAAELAAALKARGLHFWLFRRSGDPDTFREFCEGADAAALAADAGERVLRERLRALATYAGDADALWDEVAT